MTFIFPNLAQRKNGKNLDLHQSRKTKSAARIQNELFRKRLIEEKWKFLEMEDFFKCHKRITMPRMNGLLYEVSNKGFCHKRCFRKSRGTTYFTCRAMNLRKVQFCWTCCLFRYVTDRRLFVRKKEKKTYSIHDQ